MALTGLGLSRSLCCGHQQNDCENYRQHDLSSPVYITMFDQSRSRNPESAIDLRQ
jgi:hypothetical protein